MSGPYDTAPQVGAGEDELAEGQEKLAWATLTRPQKKKLLLVRELLFSYFSQTATKNFTKKSAEMM